MAALSSITRTRCMRKSASPDIGRLRRGERQRQGEGGTLAGPGAFRVQRAAQFPGRERTAVQPEAVAVRARREAVVEDPLQVLPGDADPGVDHREAPR